MISTELQVKCINAGLDYKDIIVLNYIKQNMFKTFFTSKEICDAYPAFIKSSSDVQTSLNKISSIECLNFNWDKGKIDLEYNFDKFAEFFTPEKTSKVVIKRPKKELKDMSEFSEVELDIINHYKSIPTLPRVVSMTPRRVNALRVALENFSPEKIKDAISYAGEQDWVAKKSGETWMDMSWVLTHTGDFLLGGRYHKEDEVQNTIITQRDCNVFL